MDYILITSPHASLFTNEIKIKLADGWALSGSAFSNGSLFCQAMIKEIPAVV